MSEYQGEIVRGSLGGKVNLGNYNNIDINASWETQIKPGEDPSDAFSRIWEEVEKQVDEQVTKHSGSD